MSAPVLAEQNIATGWRNQSYAYVALAAGTLALGLLFHQEVVAAVRVWIASTAYNHCFLIIPIAAYLAWDRRAALRGLVPDPWPIAALASIPLALAWLVAERLGIMEGRQLVAMSFFELLAFTILGPRLWWQVAGPLLYLYFLVPFGDFLTPRLQDVTTAFVQHGLDLLRIPAYIDGYSIEIPEGTFYIAQACAGLRFLIAAIAFGVLYALLMYRSPLRRTVFIVISFIVPIIANGLRALGIVTLGHLLGSAEAGATDHVLYGWLFFSVVILLLIFLGLPFREDLDDEPARKASVHTSPRADLWRAASIGGLLVAVVAAIPSAFATYLDGIGWPPALSVQALQLGPDCADVPVDKLAPIVAPAGAPIRTATRRVACDGLIFDVTLAVFSPHTTAAPVLAMMNRLGELPHSPDDEGFIQETDWPRPSPSAPRLWRLNRTVGPGPMSAVAIWIDGRPAAGGLAMRTHLALASLVGAAMPPVVLGVRPEFKPDEKQPAVTRAAQAKLVALLLRVDFTAQVRRLLADRRTNE